MPFALAFIYSTRERNTELWLQIWLSHCLEIMCLCLYTLAVAQARLCIPEFEGVCLRKPPVRSMGAVRT